MPEFRALLSNDSEMAQRIRAFHWDETPLGSPRDWPQSLRSTLSICLNSSYPTAIYWSPQLNILYNDAWARIMGPLYDNILGQPAQHAWPHAWNIIEPQLRKVMSSGNGFDTTDQVLRLERNGQLEESYWNYSLTPIAGEDGRVAGIFNLAQETTSRVLDERRSRLLVALADRLRAIELPKDIIATALETLAEQIDVQRLLYFSVNADGHTLQTQGCWTNGAPHISEQFDLHTMSDELSQPLLLGETLVCNDLYEDPRARAANLLERYKKRNVRATMGVPILRNGKLVAALAAHDSDPHIWTYGEIDLLKNAASRIWQEVSRSQSELALRESERRHRLVFEQASDIILTANLQQMIESCNPAAAAAIGLPANQIVGHSIGEFLAEGEFERTSAMLQRKLIEGGGTTNYEVAVRTTADEIRQWDVNSALTIDRDGRPIGLHAVARDVTEKRAFDERQQLLINELNHRVKNTLALVQGLALQSFKSERTIEQGQSVFQARLGMLAAAHDLLTKHMWEGATVAAIVADATAPYADPPWRIVAQGPHILLSPKAAISLILAVHELGTNATKYGALSNPEGRVMIDWGRTNDNFTLTWRELDGPEVTEPSHRGFGLRMIERALANDLDGKVKISFLKEGLTCTIIATLPES